MIIRQLILTLSFLPFCVVGQNAKINAPLSQWKQSVSIDGKLDEWKKSDFSYNEETRLWYSLANDDVYLYLAVKKDENFNKVFNWGGLQFLVSKLDKKDNESKSSIAFPLAVKDDRRVPHDQLTRIAVEGFQDIPEMELNLFNEYGIQVGWTLEKDDSVEYADPTYRYELAIPLAHLKTFLEANEIKFNILLRGSREFRPSPQDLALIQNMEVLMQEKLIQTLKSKTPGASMEVINKHIAGIKDVGRWTEFSSTYRLATNPDI